MNFRIKLLALVACFFAAFTFAQKENSLLWEVSGNGLKQPSYVFGTFHLMCKNDFQMKEKVKKALAKTKRTVLEVNMADPEQMKDMQSQLISDKKLTEDMNPEEIQRLEKGLESFGYTLESVNQMSPMALFSMLTVKFFDCPPADFKMTDVEVMQMTLADKKPIGGLETVNEQIEMFKKYFSPKELLKLVEDFEKGKKEMHTMIAEYKAEDLNKIMKSMHNEEKMSKEQQELMLDNRNRQWLKKMPEMMKTEPVFFAVGAGHLGGEEGVLNLLKKAGYEVKPMMK